MSVRCTVARPGAKKVLGRELLADRSSETCHFTFNGIDRAMARARKLRARAFGDVFTWLADALRRHAHTIRGACRTAVSEGDGPPAAEPGDGENSCGGSRAALPEWLKSFR